MDVRKTAQSVRTMLVSDVHLGCKHARSGEFLHFLKSYQPQRLYLVGDFVDAWKMQYGWHWTSDCDAVINHLVDLVRQGTQIFYTPGNHDSFLRESSLRMMLPKGFPEVQVANEFVYETLHGWRFLVTHGDMFDFFETRAQWASKSSSFFYDSCLSLNRWVQQRFLGAGCNPYGACAVLKGRVKRGVKFISRFETKLMRYAASNDCDGVVCGHVHTPMIKCSKATLYFNTGDWVENCTGMVEHHDGDIQLVSRYRENQTMHLAGRIADEAKAGSRQELRPAARVFESQAKKGAHEVTPSNVA